MLWTERIKIIIEILIFQDILKIKLRRNLRIILQHNFPWCLFGNQNISKIYLL